eukprot:ANDGO_01451.mRNA.1 hypothetical protein
MGDDARLSCFVFRLDRFYGYKWTLIDPGDCLAQRGDAVLRFVQAMLPLLKVPAHVRCERVTYKIPSMSDVYSMSVFCVSAMMRMAYGLPLQWKQLDSATSFVLSKMTRLFEIEVLTARVLDTDPHSAPQGVHEQASSVATLLERAFPQNAHQLMEGYELDLIISEPDVLMKRKPLVFSVKQGIRFTCAFDFDGIELSGDTMGLMDSMFSVPFTAKGVSPIVKKSNFMSFSGKKVFYVGSFVTWNVSVWMLIRHATDDSENDNRREIVMKNILASLKKNGLSVPFGFEAGRENVLLSPYQLQLVSASFSSMLMELKGQRPVFYLQKYGMKRIFQADALPQELSAFAVDRASQCSLDFAAVFNPAAYFTPLSVFANVRREPHPDETLFRRFFTSELGGFTVYPKNNDIHKIKVYTMDVHAYKRNLLDGSTFFLDLWRSTRALNCAHSSTKKKNGAMLDENTAGQQRFLENVRYCKDQSFGVRIEVSVTSKDYRRILLEFQEAMISKLHSLNEHGYAHQFVVVETRSLYTLVEKYAVLVLESIQQVVENKCESSEESVSMLVCLLDYLLSGNEKHLGGYNKRFVEWVQSSTMQSNMFPFDFVVTKQSERIRVPHSWYAKKVSGNGIHGAVIQKMLREERDLEGFLRKLDGNGMILFFDDFVKAYEKEFVTTLELGVTEVRKCTSLLAEGWERHDCGPQDIWCSVFPGKPSVVNNNRTSPGKGNAFDRYLSVCYILASLNKDLLSVFEEALQMHFTTCVDLPFVCWVKPNVPVLDHGKLSLQQPSLPRFESHLEDRSCLESFFRQIGESLGLREHQVKQFVNFLLALSEGRFENRLKSHVSNRVFLQSGVLVPPAPNETRVIWTLRPMDQLKQIHSAFYEQ